MDFDILKKVAGKAGDLGTVKDDILLLKDEADEIMKEIAELQRIAMALMARQVKIAAAIHRLKEFASID